MKHSRLLWLTTAVTVMTAATQLTGCAVAVVGGVVSAGTLIVTAGGRRSSETAEADDRIQNQASQAIETALAGRDHHVIVTSYFRKVLLTGEVVREDDRARAQAIVQSMAGVQGVVNDLAVMPPTSAIAQSRDGYITGKVKARLLGTNGVPAANIKVLTERGTVYVMGRLTRLEAQVTTDAIQQVDGVQRVARVIDIIPDNAAADGATSTVTNQRADTAPANTQATPAPGVEIRPVAQPTPMIQQPPPPQPIQVQTLPPLK